MFSFKIKQKTNGFTLIETMAAVSIIVIGLISALGTITTALFYVSNIQDRLIAVNLVAEGIEVARNIRDNNWLQNLSWNNGLANGDYIVARDSLAMISFYDVPLRLNSSNGVYDYSLGGSPTIFKRKISITNLSAYEIKVVSMTTWQRKGITYSSSAEDHLFNWK